MDFKNLSLHPDIMKGVDDAGYVTCTPVQEQVFAHSFAGRDIYAQSQTGTGKTAAFLLSIFQRMLTDPSTEGRKALIITPTRELAVQIDDEANKLGKYLGISTGTFFGGVGYGPQLDALRNNVRIMVGTPGRMIDLLEQGKMKLNEVGFLVVDEADRMFDMGFIDDIRKLMRYLPPSSMRQTFLFSATLGLRIKDLAWEWMTSPVEISIEPEHVTVDLVTQELYHVGTHEKFSLLLGLLDRERPESAIIFCNQKYMVEEVARRLMVNGVECEYIMGDLPQLKRQSIIDRLKAGGLSILVATDVASRGLDVEALDLVINYDVPDEAESYVHRIGRTARAGKAGKAITFACEKFVFNLPAVERYLGSKIPVAPFDTSLLMEDRSAYVNMRRQHGYDRSRQRDGGDARSRTDRADRKRPLPQRKAGTGAPAAHQGSATRPSPASRPAQAAARPAPGSPRAGAHENPYRMSTEERMRQYREKYASTQASAAPGEKSAASRPAPQARKQAAPEGRAPKAAAPSPAKSGGLLGFLKRLLGGSK